MQMPLFQIQAESIVNPQRHVASADALTEQAGQLSPDDTETGLTAIEERKEAARKMSAIGANDSQFTPLNGESRTIAIPPLDRPKSVTDPRDDFGQLEDAPTGRGSAISVDSGREVQFDDGSRVANSVAPMAPPCTEEGHVQSLPAIPIMEPATRPFRSHGDLVSGSVPEHPIDHGSDFDLLIRSGSPDLFRSSAGLQTPMALSSGSPSMESEFSFQTSTDGYCPQCDGSTSDCYDCDQYHYITRNGNWNDL